MLAGTAARAAVKESGRSMVEQAEINGVISIVQETGVSFQPGGVGITLSPGQLLDPLNDLIEQFSSIMLVVCVSLGMQLILLNL